MKKSVENSGQWSFGRLGKKITTSKRQNNQTTKQHAKGLCLTLAAFLLLPSCSGNGKVTPAGDGDTIRLKYARLLQMIRHKDYVEANIINPWKPENVLHHYEIRSPYRRIVVYTAAHTRLLAELHAADKIAGVCDRKYIMAKWAASLPDCGNAMNPNIEKMLTLHPDAVIASPFENSGGYGKAEQLGIPIIEAADYMETTPLGRAEWMIFYGILVGKEKEAKKLFQTIEKRYLQLSKDQKTRAKKTKIMTDMQQSSAWYVPGGASYLGQMIADAGGLYAFAGDRRSGSIPVAFETMLDKNRDADVWLIKYNAAKDLTMDDIRKNNDGFALFKAFADKNVYGCNTAYMPFYEEIPFHPDWLLEDYIKIFYGEKNAENGLKYYKKLR